MQNNRIFSALGLAQKAGQIASGEFSAEQAVKSGRAFLLIVAEDASDNTKKKMTNLAAFYEGPFYCYGSKEELGRCIGEEYRAMAAVLNQGFAKSIQKQLDNTMNN